MSTFVLDICLVLAFAGFVGLANMRGESHGPDGKMIVLLVVPVVLFFGGVLAVCIHRGLFDWVPGGRMAQYAAALGVVAGTGMLSAISFDSPDAWWSRLCAGVPFLVIAATLALLHTDFAKTASAGVLALVAVVGWVVIAGGFAAYVKDSAQEANQRAQAESAREAERSRSDLAEFQALSSDAPVWKLLDYTHSPNETVQKEARELVAARPNLDDELIAMLREGAGERAASYIARLHAAPPSKLAPAFASFLEGELPGWQSRLMGSPNPGMWQPNISSYFDAADRIQKAGGDLRPQLKQWHDYLKTVSGMNGMAMHIAPMLH